MTPRQKFAKDYGMPMHHVTLLCVLANRAFHTGEHVCNGDPHPAVRDTEDKNSNASAWEITLEGINQQLNALVKQYGFTVEYNGLRPSLLRGKETVYIP